MLVDICRQTCSQWHYLGRLCTGRNQDPVGNFFFWLGGPVYKSFPGPLFCCPPSPPNARLLLAHTVIKTLSNSFSFPWGPWKSNVFCFDKMPSSSFSRSSAYTMSMGAYSVDTFLFRSPILGYRAYAHPKLENLFTLAWQQFSYLESIEHFCSKGLM